ncbi:hypothetical protein J5N97_012720 [Dioscorea zingiberensis]|uniref:VAMP-like protein n=1 Tax=Dioscorea zingiberensis TaxID=325984 RepID=A0A9D5CPU3_9LILI|nr:hypothetical protein J5N97_012720 [Dioscorea zingiberensis]
MDKVSMDSRITNMVYCCISKGGKVLYSYNGGDRELEALAALCLENTPPFHSWYSHSVGKRTFGFLIVDDCTYFAIVDPCDGSSSVYRFLQHIRDGFRRVSKNGLQDEIFPIIQRLMASLESVNSPAASTEERSPEVWSSSDASPSTKAPLLGKHDKKAKMKERVIEVRDCEEEHVDRGVRIDVSPEQPMRGMSLQKSASTRARGQRLWCRHVKIVAAIDVFLCLVLFGIWLAVCRGFQCVS